MVYGLIGNVPSERLKAMIEVERLVWGDTLPSCVFLIRRHAAEALAENQGLAREYENLADAESAYYPVAEVSNDKELAAAISTILSTLQQIGPI